MSNKRIATSVLNQDNWNDDDVTEEMGVFKKAAACELKIRPMKVAKRRGIQDDCERESVFKNFTAFGATKTSATPTFSFLSGEKPKLTNVSPFPSFSFNNTTDFSKKSSDSTEKSQSIPSFTITASSNSVEDNKSSNVSSNKNESGSEPKSINANLVADKPSSTSSFNFNPSKISDTTKSTTETTFKFGINSTNENNCSRSPAESTFNFGIKSKESGSTDTQKNTSFKFGVNTKENESSKTTPTSFQFGIQSTSKSDISSFSKTCDPKSEPFNDKKFDVKETTKSSKVNGVESSSDVPGKNSLFLTKLKTLNLGVLNWVKQHLDKNQYINLSPIFDDYKEYYQDIKIKYNTNSKNTTPEKIKDRDFESSNKSSPENKLTGAETKTPVFNFGSSMKDSSKSGFGNQSKSSPLSQVNSSKLQTNEYNKSSETKLFSFGVSSSNSNSNTADSLKVNEADSGKSNSTTTPAFSFAFENKASAPSFSVGSSESSNKTSAFSFGIPKDNKSSEFSFDKGGTGATTPGSLFKSDSSNFATPSNNDSEKKETVGESDEVPKVEVTEVTEDDAIYEKKVKLFYKKVDEYVERGVGTLFLKPAGDKTQLLIRALTNLGNILLNIILNESIPTQRVGKNNVLIGCVPNPPITPKDTGTPVSMLIRVKTEADADELLEKIDEHKKEKLIRI